MPSTRPRITASSGAQLLGFFFDLPGDGRRAAAELRLDDAADDAGADPRSAPATIVTTAATDAEPAGSRPRPLSFRLLACHETGTVLAGRGRGAFTLAAPPVSGAAPGRLGRRRRRPPLRLRRHRRPRRRAASSVVPMTRPLAASTDPPPSASAPSGSSIATTSTTIAERQWQTRCRCRDQDPRHSRRQPAGGAGARRDMVTEHHLAGDDAMQRHGARRHGVDCVVGQRGDGEHTGDDRPGIEARARLDVTHGDEHRTGRAPRGTGLGDAIEPLIDGKGGRRPPTPRRGSSRRRDGGRRTPAPG